MLSAASESIQVWLTKVFPALFPFMAACTILLHLGTARKMSHFLRPFTKILFGLDGIAAFPFFLGILSGYPMGAKITTQLYEKKLISSKEAQHILVFSNNPGPLFLIGTIGTGFFRLPFSGYLLLISCFWGAVGTGILWRSSARSIPEKHRIIPSSAQLPLTEILSAAVSDSLRTILLIGGYLILFSAFSEALKQTGLFSFLTKTPLPLAPETLQGLSCGILEMTNGAYLMSQSPDDLRLRLAFAAFLTSFGGLSILGQTFSVLAAVPIRKKDYLKGKLMNALFSSLFCYILYPFFVQKAQKAVPVFFTFTETAFTLSFFWLLPSLFFLGVLCHAIVHRK